MAPSKKKTVVKKKVHNPKGRYIIHSRHEKLPKETREMFYISFDPGAVNFSVRVEKRCKASTGKHCKSITTLAQNKHKVTYLRSFIKDEKATKSLSTVELIDVLDSYKEFYPSMTIALIEGQMAINSNMMHMQCVIIAYFLLTQSHIVVVEVSSKLKGTRLGATDLNRSQLKKWGIEKALYLAEQRGDQVFIDYINKQKKAFEKEKRIYKAKGKGKKGDKPPKLKIDDDTDNLIQIEGFCVEAKYQLTKTVDSKPKYKGAPKLIPVKSTVKRRRAVKQISFSSSTETSTETGSCEKTLSSESICETLSSCEETLSES